MGDNHIPSLATLKTTTLEQNVASQWEPSLSVLVQRKQRRKKHLTKHPKKSIALGKKRLNGHSVLQRVPSSHTRGHDVNHTKCKAEPVKKRNKATPHDSFCSDWEALGELHRCV